MFPEESHDDVTFSGNLTPDGPDLWVVDRWHEETLRYLGIVGLSGVPCGSLVSLVEFLCELLGALVFLFSSESIKTLIICGVSASGVFVILIKLLLNEAV